LRLWSGENEGLDRTWLRGDDADANLLLTTGEEKTVEQNSKRNDRDRNGWHNYSDTQA